MNFIKNNSLFSKKDLEAFLGEFNISLNKNIPDNVSIREQKISDNIYEHVVEVALSDDATEDSLKNVSLAIKNYIGLEELWWKKKMSDNTTKRGGSYEKIYIDKYCDYNMFGPWGKVNCVLMFIIEYNPKIKNISVI